MSLKEFLSFNISKCKFLWISLSTMRATCPAHLILIYHYVHALAFLIIYDMKVCTFVIEWYVETLYEQRYLPDTVTVTMSINTLPSTGSCIGDFDNCVHVGKMHARAPCRSDQYNVFHIKENGLPPLTHPLVDGDGRSCTILQWRQLWQRPQDQRRGQQR